MKRYLIIDPLDNTYILKDTSAIWGRSVDDAASFDTKEEAKIYLKKIIYKYVVRNQCEPVMKRHIILTEPELIARML